jgi:hypothetical protein
MVGPNGLEPSTSSVSGRRSNQLSYGPSRRDEITARYIERFRKTGRHARVKVAL